MLGGKTYGDSSFPRHGAKRLGPVVVPAFSSRPLRIELGHAARERRRLAFAGPAQFLQPLFKLFETGFELRVVPFQSRDASIPLDAASAGGNVRVDWAGIHAAAILCTGGQGAKQ